MKSRTIEQLPHSTAPQFQRDLLALIPHLRAFSHSLCRRRDLGEDLAQDALAKAWRSRGSFDPGTNLKAWLFTILRNEFYSQKRRAWRQTDWDEAKGHRIAGAPDAQLWSLALSDTAHALRELPEGQREALILIAAGGFSYEDAANICGTKVGTMKSRVARGRQALLNMLDGKDRFTRCASVSHDGGSHDILAQLNALTPADTRGAAHA